MLFTQQPQVRVSAFPIIYVDVAEIYRQGWLEESGLRLENVDQTHLVLASGKIVLQKDNSFSRDTIRGENVFIKAVIPILGLDRMTILGI